MTVPQKVKVGGIVYSVEKKDVVEVNGSRDYYGSCSYRDTTIEIMNGLPEERAVEVFIHGLLHAILYEAGFDNHEEELVERASKGLYQVLKDNPGLLTPTQLVISSCEVDVEGLKESLKNVKPTIVP